MQALDWFFHFLHIIVIIINTTFWMSRRTIKIAQATLILTAMSWVGFGYFYGFGYCFLTDWHWQIKEALGETELPASYIKYIVDHTFNVDSDARTVDIATVAANLISVIGCIVNRFRWR